MAEEEVQATNAPAAPPAKKKKGPMGMILILLFATCLAGGAGYYFYGKTVMESRLRSKAANDGKAAGKDDKGGSQRDDRKDDRHDEAKGEIGPIVPLDPFVMNVSGNSSRYVKMGVAIEVKNEKVTEEVKKMTPAIRDAMLTVLGAKPPEAFMDSNGRAAMKKELFDSVAGFFKKGDLQAVYITDIIMQ
jgi:flagellar protein FliL